MLGLGKGSTARAPAMASSARSRYVYQRYAVALYRQALLAFDDPALAEQVVCDVIVNERALALMPERRSGQRLFHPGDLAAVLRAVLRRLAASSAAAQDGDQA
jgi:hypothetical protein